tara:strand:+ start:449 stop:1084 length:636 start_codon:yes stop_codon:yes gene_type:complete
MKRELKKRIFSSILIIPISFFFIIQESALFLFFLCVLFLIAGYEWININKKNNFTKLMGITVLFISFYSAYHLRQNFSINYFIFVILVCMLTDIGGFTFGKIFGGPKLIKISPNKTYAGMIGSFLLPLFIGLILIEYLSQKITHPTHQILLYILIISLISQVGDIIISFFKRKAKVKDTGKIIPGHGGLLDRLDGLIFVFLFLYLLKFIQI